MKGRITRYWGKDFPGKVNVFFDLPNRLYQFYFPKGIFHHIEDFGGKYMRYWSNCDAKWFREKFGDANEGQRLEVRIMSDNSLRYRAVPLKRITKGMIEQIEREIRELLPDSILKDDTL